MFMFTMKKVAKSILKVDHEGRHLSGFSLFCLSIEITAKALKLAIYSNLEQNNISFADEIIAYTKMIFLTPFKYRYDSFILLMKLCTGFLIFTLFQFWAPII